MKDAFVASTAQVSGGAAIGPGTHVWHYAQIREDASVGRNCTVGSWAYIGPGVRVGDNVKIQNHALIYEPAQLADGVFVGPAAVLTNDHFPRAVKPDGTPKGPDDWQAVGVTLLEGASLGARVVCVAPVTIGRWAMVAAGATVIHNVLDFALVAGTPARRIRWVGRAGVPLEPSDEPQAWRCPRTGMLYHEDRHGALTEIG